MGMIVCPHCDRMIENPEIAEIAGLTEEQINLLWQIKDIAYKLYGVSCTHPDIQKWVSLTTEHINNLLESYDFDPVVHIIK